MKKLKTRLAELSVILLFFSCQPSGPEPVNFGKDQCHFCKMTISDPKFGAELITDKGRIYKYDAAECMIDHIQEESPSHHQLYAIAYDQPKKLYAVDSLHFIISPDFKSPMGENLAAFSKKNAPDKKYREQLIRWEQLLKVMKE